MGSVTNMRYGKVPLFHTNALTAVKPYCALCPCFDRVKLFFSRPMRDRDTCHLKKVFQNPSLVEKPLDQCEIATY